LEGAFYPPNAITTIRL